MKFVGDFEELHSVSSLSTDALNFNSQDFRVIRVILRLLSLWRPRSAGFLESYVYPICVNLLLLTIGIIRNSIQATMKPTWLSIQLLYIVHEFVVWLGHIFGNRYFASRDLESNVLRPVKPLIGIRKPLHRRLKVLNVVVIVSMTFFSIMLVVLFVVTEFKWNKGHHRFSAALPHVDGPIDHILYGLVLLLIVYDLGIGLALFWTLALLFSCYAARLKVLENIFLNWKHSSVEAVSFFIKFYARPVKNSWKRMSLWFLAHNIVALAIPLYGFELAQALSGREYHSKHLPQFICYLFFILTIWLAPIVVAEQIKRRERMFQERINDISPWLLETGSNAPGGTRVHSAGDSGIHSLSDDGVYTLPVADANSLTHRPRQTPSLDLIGSTFTEGSDNVPKYTEYTFVSRGKEFRKFLQFLKARTPGLVSRGYSLQLNLSLISLLMGVVSFLTELHSKSMNSQDVMYKCCNCTLQ